MGGDNGGVLVSCIARRQHRVGWRGVLLLLLLLLRDGFSLELLLVAVPLQRGLVGLVQSLEGLGVIVGTVAAQQPGIGSFDRTFVGALFQFEYFQRPVQYTPSSSSSTLPSSRRWRSTRCMSWLSSASRNCSSQLCNWSR
ncbi:hypothetical protein D3C81_1242920 [compost metagenome]